MININIREKNNIVTLDVPGKSPILSRSGSATFYNSLELICISLGSCFGGELVKICSENNINPSIFESIYITLTDFKPIINIQHPKDLDKEIINSIRLSALNCPIAKMLNKTPEIIFFENKTKTNILVDQTKRSKCCGG